jgi:transposase
LIDTIPTDPAKAELLGVSEIAKIFGVHPATVSKWVQRGRLPEPLARLASGTSGTLRRSSR